MQSQPIRQEVLRPVKHSPDDADACGVGGPLVLRTAEQGQMNTPTVTSKVTLTKYAVHGLFPDDGRETRAEIPRFRVWTTA